MCSHFKKIIVCILLRMKFVGPKALWSLSLVCSLLCNMKQKFLFSYQVVVFQLVQSAHIVHDGNIPRLELKSELHIAGVSILFCMRATSYI